MHVFKLLRPTLSAGLALLADDRVERGCPPQGRRGHAFASKHLLLMALLLSPVLLSGCGDLGKTPKELESDIAFLGAVTPEESTNDGGENYYLYEKGNITAVLFAESRSSPVYRIRIVLPHSPHEQKVLAGATIRNIIGSINGDDGVGDDATEWVVDKVTSGEEGAARTFGKTKLAVSMANDAATVFSIH